MTKTSKSDIRKYFVEFGIAMIAYTIVLMTVVAMRPDGDEYQGPARFLELLPILPLLGAFWAIIRQFRRMDEYYQRIHAEAFALGAMTWGLIIMAWGFVENAGGPQLSTMFVAPGLIAFWGLSLPIIAQRYK